MKKVFVILAIIFFSFNKIIIIAQDDPRCSASECYNSEAADCQDPGGWRFVCQLITIPQYPNCTLQVSYCWRECSGNEIHKIQIDVQKVDFFYDACQNCRELWEFLHENGSLSDRRMLAFFNMIVQKISLDNFSLWYQAATQEIKDMVECISGGYHAKANWWLGSCSAWCYYSTLENGQLRNNFTKIDCDVTLCCGIEYRYCYNSQTQSVEVTSVHLTDPNIDCSTLPPPPLSECPDGFDKEITDCISSCNEL